MARFALAIEDKERTYTIPNLSSDSDLRRAVESVLDRRVSEELLKALPNGIDEGGYRLSVEGRTE